MNSETPQGSKHHLPPYVWKLHIRNYSVASILSVLRFYGAMCVLFYGVGIPGNNGLRYSISQPNRPFDQIQVLGYHTWFTRNRIIDILCGEITRRGGFLHGSINSLRPRPNRRHFADDIFKYISGNENEWISPRISLKFVPKVRINNIPALVQIMAWRRPGDKPLSEPVMVRSLTHICVTRPQWVKAEESHKI